MPFLVNIGIYPEVIGPRPDRPLGRQKEHDERSREFAAAEPDHFGLLQVKKWERRSPIFDQGQLGSCTTNAAAGHATTDWQNAAGKVIKGRTGVKEADAVALYSRATHLDRIPGAWKPDDTGSSGIAAAKALIEKKWAKSYHHAFSLAALCNSLQHGAVMVGTDWYDSMFDTDSDGFVDISPGAEIVGGHEWLIRGIDPDRKEFYADNSWGTEWGLQGSMRFTWETVDRLLHQDGDVTIPMRE